jgi:DNA-binding NarL/FixJ family response regulator
VTTPPPASADTTRANLRRLADLHREYTSERDPAILAAVSAGLDYDEIADILSITRKTVQRVVAAANAARNQTHQPPESATESDG